MKKQEELNADTYLLEFVERMSRPDSFPDRRIARHLSEIFACWIDLNLIAVKINDEEKLHNATDEEYDAFVQASFVTDTLASRKLSDLLESFKKGGIRYHADVYDLAFDQEIWKNLEASNPDLSKGACTRLCGSQNGDRKKSRELFLYLDLNNKPEIWIELYGGTNIVSPVREQLVDLCDRVVTYLRGGAIQLNLQANQARWENNERGFVELPQRVDDPKILFPYVEATMWYVTQLIHQTFQSQGFKVEDFIRPVDNHHRDILREFVFMINTARNMNDLVPNNVGYHLTASQIKAIRDYVSKNENEIVTKLTQSLQEVGKESLQSLMDSRDRINPDQWIDRMQNQIFVTVDENGLPNKPAYGLSSYVMKVRQSEYVQEVEKDARLGKPVNYPVDLLFVEDQFIHGKYLLMIPIFLNGKVGALFWMNSNIPITPKIRFLIMSTVRRHEYMISSAIMMQWQVVKPILNEKEQKILSEWVRALEDLTIHPLISIKGELVKTQKAGIDNGKRADQIDFVIEILRSLAKHDQEVDKSYEVNLFDTVEGIIDRLDLRGNRVAYHNNIDKSLCIYTNRPLFTEVLRIVAENSYKEALKNKTAISPSIIINAEYLSDEKSAQVQVWDSGKEFQLNIRENLFETRVESTHSGSGVGLRLARLIIDRLGGSIKLDDKDNKTIYINIPCG